MLVEAGVVDGDAGAAPELLGERKVRGAVRASRFRGAERDDTEDVPACRERHDDRRTVGERAQVRQVFGVACHPHEHLVRDFRNQHRLPRAEDLGARMPLLGVRRIDLGAPQNGSLRRVGAGHRQPADGPVRLDDVHRAPVGQERDRELRDRAQRLLVVERGPEVRAHAGQELLMRRARLRPRPGAPEALDHEADRQVHGDEGHEPDGLREVRRRQRAVGPQEERNAAERREADRRQPRPDPAVPDAAQDCAIGGEIRQLAAPDGGQRPSQREPREGRADADAIPHQGISGAGDTGRRIPGGAHRGGRMRRSCGEVNAGALRSASSPSMF